MATADETKSHLYNFIACVIYIMEEPYSFKVNTQATHGAYCMHVSQSLYKYIRQPSIPSLSYSSKPHDGTHEIAGCPWHLIDCEDPNESIPVYISALCAGSDFK